MNILEKHRQFMNWIIKQDNAFFVVVYVATVLLLAISMAAAWITFFIAFPWLGLLVSSFGIGFVWYKMITKFNRDQANSKETV